MALSKVTFFDNTYFKLDESITDKACKDFVKADDTTTLSYNGIYFTPKYDETKTDINTSVHHIAHNGHIYTLGSDVIEDNSSYYSYYDCEINDTNTSVSIISSLEANTFEKTIKYKSLNIDFSDILGRISELEEMVKILYYGPEPSIEDMPNIVLYYILYNDNGNPERIISSEPLTNIKSNANKILLPETIFNEYTKDTFSDNTNYILKDNDGRDIKIDNINNFINNNINKDNIVIGIGIDNRFYPNKYEITNICLPDEYANKYGRQIHIDNNSKINILNNYGSSPIIKILDKQDKSIRISAIVYKIKNQ